MLRRLISENIELVTRLDPMLGRIKADPGQIEQIIMNLAVNAYDAMPQGGRLILETANIDLDEGFTGQQVGLKPGPYVRLIVSDTGIGMDAETQSHIFEPFFTTKKPGKGTGLGLAMVYGIVQQSEGYISVVSRLGQGTTFNIYLPRLEQEITPMGSGQPATETKRGSETILLVEDEEMVRELARYALQQNGYHILEAQHGREALDICGRHDGPIHLLLTDVVMPAGLSGRQLAEQVVTTHPQIKVLYMSGYANDAIIQQGMVEPGIAFLQKPFMPSTLTRKVREVLDN
jgi:two-component system cell cycle sensor histidine kinase/response regulator CckA